MAALLLPLLACAFTIQNTRHAQPMSGPPDQQLFPTEQHLLINILNEPPAQGIWEQHDQLRRGWEQYLVSEWFEEKNTPKLSSREEQIASAAYRFNLARLELWRKAPPPKLSQVLASRYSVSTLAFFFLWNLFVALFVNRRSALV